MAAKWHIKDRLLDRLRGAEGLTAADIAAVTPERLEGSVAGRSSAAAKNPVENVIHFAAIKAYAEKREPTLSDVVQLGIDGRYPGTRRPNADQLANMQHIDFPTVLREAGCRHFIFDGEGLKRLRDWAHDSALAVNLNGSVLSGCIITPQSGFPGIGMSGAIQPHDGLIVQHADLTGVLFEGFDQPCTMHLIHMQLENAVFHGKGNRAMTQAGLHLIHAQAQGIDLSGAKLANLTCESSNVDFIQAEHALVIKVHAHHSSLRGGGFNDASFGPGSLMTHCDLTGTDFTGAQIGDLDLRHSQLCGTQFVDVDISRVDFSGAVITAESLIGAIGPQGRIETLEQAHAFMKEKGMQTPKQDKTQAVASLADARQRHLARRRQQMQAPAEPKISNLDAAMMAVYAQMSQGGLKARTNGVCAADHGTKSSVGLADRHKVNRSQEYIRRLPQQ